MNQIRVSQLTIIVSDDVFSHDWHQAIIWTNSDILLIGHLGTNLMKSKSKLIFLI